MTNCAQCAAPDASASCGRCGKAKYCGRDCQRAAWPQHKRVCGKEKDNPCTRCGRPRAALRCSRCRVARFCDRECQRAAWARHRPQCLRGDAPPQATLDAAMRGGGEALALLQDPGDGPAVERAIELLEAALDAFQGCMPVIWGVTAVNLGQALLMREQGDLTANREAALERFVAAKGVLTRDAHRSDYARAAAGAALVCATRPPETATPAQVEEGVRMSRDALEALDPRDPEDAPQWRSTAHNLGELYLRRGGGGDSDRRANLEAAAARFRDAQSGPEPVARARLALATEFGSAADAAAALAGFDEALAALAPGDRGGEAWRSAALGAAAARLARGQAGDMEAAQALLTAVRAVAERGSAAWGAAALGLGQAQLAVCDVLETGDAAPLEAAEGFLREALQALSPAAQPSQWAAAGVGLGCALALRLRATAAPPELAEVAAAALRRVLDSDACLGARLQSRARAALADVELLRPGGDLAEAVALARAAVDGLVPEDGPGDGPGDEGGAVWAQAVLALARALLVCREREALGLLDVLHSVAADDEEACIDEGVRSEARALMALGAAWLGAEGAVGALRAAVEAHRGPRVVAMLRAALGHLTNSQEEREGAAGELEGVERSVALGESSDSLWGGDWRWSS